MSFFEKLSERATRGDLWVLLLVVTWLLCLTVLALCAFTNSFDCVNEVVDIFAGILKILIGATTVDLGINVFWRRQK